jgi:cytochrome P450
MTTKFENAGSESDSPKPVSQFAFPSPEVTKCPYPFYEALRREAPVYKYPGRNDYLVSRREDIVYVMRHPEIFSSRHYLGDPYSTGASEREVLENTPPGRVLQTSFTLIHSDPPDHTAKRRELVGLVQARYIRSCEDTLRRIANELVDSFIQRGEVELRSEFADPLALFTICELAGFPPEDRDIFSSWHRMGTHSGARFLPPERWREQTKDDPARAEYCRKIIFDRSQNPRDDFLTELIQNQVARDGELNLPYLTGTIEALLTAGNETTSRLIANVTKLLIEHPDQLKKVLDDRSLIPNAIDEALRFESPTQWTTRFVMEDAEIAGVPIPKGAFVVMLYGSANRDDSWSDPDRFLVDRPGVRTRHLAFGDGIHKCIGLPIALAEGKLALEVILERLKNLHLSSGHEQDHENIDNFQKRAPKRLFLEFDPA